MSSICFIIVMSLLVIYFAYEWWKRQRQKKNLLIAVQECLYRRQKIIEEVSAKCAEVAAERKRIIGSLELDELIGYLQSGKCTAMEVLRTYQEKAIRAHNATNCITTFITESNKWAEELDEKAKNPTYKRPPLFGVPFSVKECIKVKGYAQTRGYAQELNSVATEDSVIVQQIKELGGIPFVLTNVPQSLLSYSCVNPIYGTTTNIYAANKTCGGSSGGEAALISAGGSIIGIGGDVGGSIRYPCHFCGIAGIKPSHLRFSQRGMLASVPGRPLVNSSIGPMTKYITHTITFLRIIWSDKWLSRHDPYVPPVQWDEKQFNRKESLRIGFYVDDKWFTPIPVMQRAVQYAMSILEGCGHTLIRFDPPDVTNAFRLFVAAVTVDGGHYLLNKFDKDLTGKGYEILLYMMHIPVVLRRVLAFFVAPFFPRIGHFLSSFPLNTSELRQVYEDIMKYRDAYLKRIQDLQFDAILCPVHVLPAVEHHIPMQLTSAASYCGIFNLIDFAAGTVRITKVNEEDEEDLRDYPETDLWYRIAKRAAEGSVGLPVGVQVAAPPYREETVLRILADIERCVRKCDE